MKAEMLHKIHGYITALLSRMFKYTSIKDINVSSISKKKK